MVSQIRRLSTFVMATGRGHRLDPLTRDRAKAAIPFGGTYRIIDIILSNCINSGIRRINILTQYKSHSLAHHIKMGWNIFHSELGEYIDVLPAQQRVGGHWYKGTADAIYQNFYSIEREHPEYVLILACNHLYKMDYSRMLTFHIERQADVTLGVVNLPSEENPQFGVLEVDSEDRVTGFEEETPCRIDSSGHTDRVHVSTGIYIFNVQTLREELTMDAGQEGTHDFRMNILPRLPDRRRLFAYHFVDENRTEPPYLRDIWSIEAYYQANMDLVSVSPQFNLYDKRWPIRTYQPQCPPLKMVFANEGKSARRGEALDSLISSGCIISGGTVIRSVLSPHVRIHSYSLVEDCVLMEGVEVGRYAKIRNAIIDKHVRIPPAMSIGYDVEEDRKRFTVTSSGVVVIPTGTVFDFAQKGFPWSDATRSTREILLPAAMTETSDAMGLK